MLFETSSSQVKVTRSAKGSPSGGAGERSETERARTLTEMYRHSDSIALTKGLLIAARRLSGDGLALSVTFGDSFPKGGATGVSGRPTRDEQSLILSETVVPCYRGQQLLDKSTLSSCCESL